MADRTNVVVFQTLSKRSSMTGYRSGFVAGPPERDRGAAHVPADTGTAPQEFVQRASVVAWNDEEHVERDRERVPPQARRPARRARPQGLARRRAARRRCTSGSRFPDGETSEAFAERLLEHGVVVAPGSYLGAAGEGYVRIALVPTLEECERAAAILEEVL